MKLCVNNIIYLVNFADVLEEVTLTRPICGNRLKETGTISPITKMVQDSFKVHSEFGYRRKNWVLEETRLQGGFRGWLSARMAASRFAH